MKCVVCKKEYEKNGSIVCSENCQNIRLEINRLLDKYTPTNGCENCWGDLHQGCTVECKLEFKKARDFAVELYELIRLAKETI